MPDKIRVLLADDHTIVRAGVRLFLEGEPDMELVGEALKGTEALTLAESLRPDVVLMDMAMPDLNGFEATRQIQCRLPEVHVLVLAMHRSDDYLFEVLKAGASGYVLKAAETNELISAIHAVARGEVFLYPTVARQLLQDYLNRLNDAGTVAGPALTPREKEILRLLAEGYSNKEIAERLVVSPSTIHSHRSNLMKKLNLSSRRDLIQYARERGWLPASGSAACASATPRGNRQARRSGYLPSQNAN